MVDLPVGLPAIGSVARETERAIDNGRLLVPSTGS